MKNKRLFLSRKKYHKGFTMIELLVVMAIVGLAATLAMLSLVASQKSARDARRLADLKSIQKALEFRFTECGSYPYVTTFGEFSVDESNNENNCESGEKGIGGYMSQVPFPPTATYNYSYLSTSDGAAYVLGTQLENASHAALGQDSDTDISKNSGYIGARWTSTGSSVDDANKLNCSDNTDPYYCITN